MAIQTASRNAGSMVRLRVGEGTMVNQWLTESFGRGVDVGVIGNLSAADVNAASQRAQYMQEQVEFAKVYGAALKKILECTEKIEAIRKEAIDAGLKTKEQIDKYVRDVAIKEAQHEMHIRKMNADTSHGRQVAYASGQAQLNVGEAGFKQRLAMVAAQHKATLAGMGVSYQAQMQNLKDAPQRAQTAQKRREYLTATGQFASRWGR